MNLKRCYHASVVCKDTIYVLGGEDGYKSATCEAYDNSKNEWRILQPMIVRKCWQAAIVMNDQFIYTIGGYDSRALDAI